MYQDLARIALNGAYGTYHLMFMEDEKEDMDMDMDMLFAYPRHARKYHRVSI